MSRGRSEQMLVQRWDGASLTRRPDRLVVEEPLEIHLDDTLVATTMRTPGHDFELAAGYCHTEGLLGDAEVRTCRYCGTGSAVETGFNVVRVDTGGKAPPPTPRLQPTSSSCGLCGSPSLDELSERLTPSADSVRWSPAVLASVPERMLSAQELFASTGAAHAAGAFDAHGVPVVVREDIGRHNAVDKVVGHLLLGGALPASDLGLFVSGRASFEMVQKAWAAGFSAVVAVSAPSALAVHTAVAGGLTLAGFVRKDTLNIYAEPSR